MSTMMHTPVEQFPLDNLMGKLATDEDAFFAQSVDGSTPSVSSDADSASHDDDESKAQPNPKVVVATDQQEGNMLSTCADDAHCVAESNDAVADLTGNADHPIAALSSQSIVATGEADMDIETQVSVVESPEPTWDSKSAESNENGPTTLPCSEVRPPTQPDSEEHAAIHDFPPVVEESTSPILTAVHIDVSTFTEDAHAKVGFEDEVRSVVHPEADVVSFVSVPDGSPGEDKVSLIEDPAEEGPLQDSDEAIPLVEESTASTLVQDSDDAVALAEENTPSDPILDTAEPVPSSIEENTASTSVQDSYKAVPLVEENTVSAPKIDVQHSSMATAAEIPSAFTTSHSADVEDPVAYRVSDAEDIPAELVVENRPGELSSEESDVLSPWDTTDQTLAEDVEVPDVKEPEIQNKLISHYPILDEITDSHAEFDVKTSATTEIVQHAEGPAMLTVVVPAVGEYHLDEAERSSSPDVSIRDVHEFDATEIEADVEATIRALLALSPINEKTQYAVLPSVGEIDKIEEEVEADATAVKFDPLVIEEESIIEEQQVTTPAGHEEDGSTLVEEVDMTSNGGKVYFDAEPEMLESERDVEHNLAIDVDALASPFFTCPDTPYGEDEIRDRYAISDEVLDEDEDDDDDLGHEDDNEGDGEKYALSDAEQSIKGKDVITITTVDYDRTKTKGLVRFVDVEPETPSEVLSQDEVLSELSPIYEEIVDGDASNFNQGGCVDCVIL